MAISRFCFEPRASRPKTASGKEREVLFAIWPSRHRYALSRRDDSVCSETRGDEETTETLEVLLPALPNAMRSNMKMLAAMSSFFMRNTGMIYLKMFVKMMAQQVL